MLVFKNGTREGMVNESEKLTPGYCKTWSLRKNHGKNGEDASHLRFIANAPTLERNGTGEK